MKIKSLAMEAEKRVIDMTAFNCSMTTANRIKSSGKIDEAISQSGRMIAVDVDLALKLFKEKQ